MPRNGYLTIEQALSLVEQPIQEKLRRILDKYRKRFEKATGSSTNHQAWVGGYADHLAEVLNIAHLLYGPMNACRPLPFSLSDALVALFLHDIEKPFKDLEVPTWEGAPYFAREKDRKKHWILENVIKVDLPNDSTVNAIFYAEGEVFDYSNQERKMGELAAFVHMCDIASARLWHDRPLEENDSWGQRCRAGMATCWACKEGIQDVFDLVKDQGKDFHKSCFDKTFPLVNQKGGSHERCSE